jgi:hypothetical protein
VGVEDKKGQLATLNFVMAEGLQYRGLIPSTGKVLYDFVWQVVLCGCGAQSGHRRLITMSEAHLVPLYKIFLSRLTSVAELM